MKKKNIILILYFVSIVCRGCSANTYTPEQQQLRKEIAQMLMIGFRGTTLTKENHIYQDIKDLHIGGVILFEYDAPSGKRPRNIESALQVAKLNSDLQAISQEKLFISIDQEGGFVSRLKTKYGFPPTVSAQYQGMLNNEDSTTYWAKQTAKMLSESGFNLNFAPCTDLNINPECPVIGKIERSFSSNPTIVVRHALIWISEQEKYGILSCLKHFPGHGSSKKDTHLGMVDVSDTWTETELIPYQNLIEKESVDMIMTSHIYNKHLDSVYPSTLSKKVITDLLRYKMGFQGVVITDDLAMGAMTKYYDFETILEKSILAGADILCLSNNGEIYDEKIAIKAIDAIYKMVQEGKISRQRISESYNRIKKLKMKIK